MVYIYCLECTRRVDPCLFATIRWWCRTTLVTLLHFLYVFCYLWRFIISSNVAGSKFFTGPCVFFGFGSVKRFLVSNSIPLLLFSKISFSRLLITWCAFIGSFFNCYYLFQVLCMLSVFLSFYHLPCCCHIVEQC